MPDIRNDFFKKRKTSCKLLSKSIDKGEAVLYNLYIPYLGDCIFERRIDLFNEKAKEFLSAYPAFLRCADRASVPCGKALVYKLVFAYTACVPFPCA